MLNDITRVLIVRTDRIGDVVLTTPAIAALRAKLPQARIVGLVSSLASDVYRLNPHLNDVIIVDAPEHHGLFGFFRLIRKIRSEKFQVAVVCQSGGKTALAIFLAGIGYRIGPLSKWWSWLVFNMGRRQNRSAVEMHEADYNLQLLRDFGITVADTREKTYLQVSSASHREAMRFFVERGLNPRFKTVAIHPGMSGSALNWPESNYLALGRKLSHRYNILVTGGPNELALVDRVVQGISKTQSYAPEQPVIAKYIGDKGLSEFIAILNQCDGVIAPSTGPLHLATALGKKVVSIFSPIKVQSAVRWGPYGVSLGTNLGIAPEDGASVLVPDVNCAEDHRCALSACIYYPCMPRVSVEDVETQLLVLLEGASITMYKANSFSGYDLDQTVEVFVE